MFNGRAIIMRGIPGSGKTTAAKDLASGFGKIPGGFLTESCVTYFVTDDGKKIAAIHSTDEFFMKDGEYRWTQSDLHRNHTANHKAFCESMKNKIPLVICDNTNSTRKEFWRYKSAAEENNYLVSFHELPHPTVAEANARNTHNVPSDVIKKMIERWE